MKALLSLLFILTSCNLYELAGDKTQISDQLQGHLPHIALNNQHIKVDGAFALDNPNLRFNIHGGEFIDANGTWAAAYYNVDASDINSVSGWGSYNVLAVTKVDNHTIDVAFPSPGPGSLGPNGTIKNIIFEFLPGGYNTYSGAALPKTQFTIKFEQVP